MSFSQLRKHLPELNGTVLDFIFAHVYDIVETSSERQGLDDSKLLNLFRILQALQTFNYRHRPNETRQVFGPMCKHLNFELNSDGTTLWLSLLLAIKELYELSMIELNRKVQLSHVRK